MKAEFLNKFKVEPTNVLTELVTLRCDGNKDVEEYTVKFNTIAAKYTWQSHDEPQLKEAYLGSLPFKLKETMYVHRDPNSYSLQKLQQETLRTNKQMHRFYQSNPRTNNTQGETNKDVNPNNRGNRFNNKPNNAVPTTAYQFTEED